jgi:hypothetical protein
MKCFVLNASAQVGINCLAKGLDDGIHHDFRKGMRPSHPCYM